MPFPPSPARFRPGNMTKIYLIRHGEAEGNLYRRMQGTCDGALTELGYRQAQALAERFRDIPLDGVYSSDLYRAMYTASGLCLPRKLPLITDRRFREVNVGVWEDLPFGSAWAHYPEEMAAFAKDPYHWRLEGADLYEDLSRRGIEALTELAEKYPNGSVAVCSHSFLIGSILSGLFYGFDHYDRVGRSENTAVTLLTVENGRFQLVFKHDSSHLDGTDLRRKATGSTSDSPSDINPNDLHFAPLGSDLEQYIRYRKDAWELIYGSLEGFSGSGFWLDAQNTMGPDPNALAVAYHKTTPVGLIQLSPHRDSHKGVGYIPFIYLRPQFRHQGLGIQLIGHAVSFYRNLDRKKLQLSVAPTNVHAIAFYEKFGFTAVGKNKGRFGKLILMEKDISLPRLPRQLKVIPNKP